MDAYIDLDHFRSLVTSGGNVHFKACLALLKANYNLRFSFLKDAIQKEKKKDRFFMDTFFKAFTSGRGGCENSFGCSAPNPYSTTDAEHLTAIYLMDVTEGDDKIRRGGLLVSPVGDEIKTLCSLFVEKDGVYSKEYYTPEFTDWGVIGNNASPCTDIIITDGYLFAEADTNYCRNSYEVIRQLYQHCQGGTVNIVIFTNMQHKVGSVETAIPIQRITDGIKDGVKQSGCVANITFVFGSGEHDRTIITNYKKFTSGDSFKYFDNGGNFTSRGTNFNVYSLADTQGREIADKYLSKLQEAVDRIMNDGTRLDRTIVGDKKSNFLKFPK